LSIKTITVKGRNFFINKYYQSIARFDFKELCAENLWAEDYLSIVKQCSLIVIDNIPNFNDENVNEQQRFITLIDIIYEKKFP
jgi:Predicted ATPase